MRARLFAFGLACLVLVTWFHHGLGFNPTSRLLTVYGLVEQHHLWADDWRRETGDYATVGPHTYSDKAPLSSFLVLPAYWAWRQIEGGPQQPRDREKANHFGVLFASALPFAAFAMMLLVRARREGAHAREAVWLALFAAFGTCLANYGGTYFGHMLAAALFLGSYVLACEREEHFALAGALGGLSVLTEYPLAVLQIVIFGYLLLGPQRWRRAIPYGLGALPMAIAMVGWNKLVTGAWLDFPYNHVPAQWAAMKTAFGMRAPDPSAMWELAFGQYRGLAFYAPLLLLAVPLICSRFAGPTRRQVLALTLLASYFLLISSYFKWDGGWCTGPRHLSPVIALGTYEGLAAAVRLRRHWTLFIVLAIFGGLVSAAASATNSMPSENFKAPAFEIFFPDLLKGHLTDHSIPFELGLPNGRYIFVAFLALFGITGAAFGRWFERAALKHAPRAEVPLAPPDGVPAK